MKKIPCWRMDHPYVGYKYWVPYVLVEGLIKGVKSEPASQYIKDFDIELEANHSENSRKRIPGL